MCMFMGLVAWINNGMVASSSPVGGSGTLQQVVRVTVPLAKAKQYEGGLVFTKSNFCRRHNCKFIFFNIIDCLMLGNMSREILQ